MRKVLFLLVILLNLQVVAYHLGCTIPSACLYAQNYGNEGFYECEDDDGSFYYSSLPCGQEVCVTVCPLCHTSYPCYGTHYCTYVPPGSSGEDITWNTGGYDDGEGDNNDNDNNYNDDGGGSVGGTTGYDETLISMFALKLKDNVKLIDFLKLPPTLHKQTKKFECVVRAIAFISELKGFNYNTAYEVLSEIASKKYDLRCRGIEYCDINLMFEKYCKITVEEYDTLAIDRYIDDGIPIAAITCDESPHMVVVIGYDKEFYYTAAGYSEVKIYQKSQLGYEDVIFLFNITAPYQCKQKPF